MLSRRNPKRCSQRLKLRRIHRKCSQNLWKKKILKQCSRNRIQLSSHSCMMALF
jgi:hypothetical protein